MPQTPSDTPIRADAATPPMKLIPRIAIQAFCETREVADLIEAAAQDRRMAKAYVKVQMGGLGVAVEFYHNAPTPNLVIVESREGHDALLAQLDSLAEVCDPGSKVFLIGHVNDVLLFRELMRRGVSEYMVAPFDLLDLIKSIGDLYNAANAAPVGRTIGFYGAKGGCGASTISHNVAWAIGQTISHDVVLADLDLPFGTGGIDFNQDPTQGLADALLAPERIDDVYLDRLLTKCSTHFNLLAAPATLDRVFDIEEGAMEPIIDAVRTNVPALVLDIPHIWTGWTRRTLKSLDEAVVVACPDLASLRNAKTLIDFLKASRPNDSMPKLVVNMFGVPKRPEIKPEDFAKALDMPLTAAIPFEPHLFGTAANNGQMIAEMDPKHPVVETFRHLALVVTGRSDVQKSRRSGGLPFLSRLMRRG